MPSNNPLQAVSYCIERWLRDLTNAISRYSDSLTLSWWKLNSWLKMKAEDLATQLNYFIYFSKYTQFIINMKAKGIFDRLWITKAQKEEEDKEKERQSKINQEHHETVMARIKMLEAMNTKELSNAEIWRFMRILWESIELSGKLYYKHPWLEDEFYTLVKIEKDYDLRVWWYTQQFLRVKGRGIARTIRQ
ncbi:unnamed protein product [Blepharisma stoltei]|uniref:Uncharacterized protein n=1 Tax=Blepharisma stoltei TaxID=1481888 RepID=A0AAU9JIA5_9CILI|nr:unnamed protein product [Blepharisma stoltei]